MSHEWKRYDFYKDFEMIAYDSNPIVMQSMLNQLQLGRLYECMSFEVKSFQLTVKLSALNEGQFILPYRLFELIQSDEQFLRYLTEMPYAMRLEEYDAALGTVVLRFIKSQ